MRGWAKEAVRKLSTGEGESKGTGSKSMNERLNGLVSSLEPTTQAIVLEAVDAHAVHLAKLNDLSLARLQHLIASSSSPPDTSNSSDYSSSGPGVYLARWQSLLDSTPITPATPRGPLRHGRDVKHTTTAGKTGVAGSRMLWHVESSGEEDDDDGGLAAPNVDVVVRALGVGFGDVVREVARDKRGI